MIINTNTKTLIKPKKSRLALILLIAGVVLVTLNLRPSLTAVGPLIGMIQSDTGLSNMAVGFLTTLPLVVLGIFSVLAPRIARQFGIKFTLFLSLILITIGILLRVLTPVSALFFGTFLVGIAIAMGNVLMPSLIKSDFPNHIGIMTGLYSTLLNLGAAIGSGISVPLALSLGLGWRGSLACWVIIALLAIVVWLPQLRDRHLHVKIRAPKLGGRIWKSPLAWQVTIFMGIQSMTFYSAAAWLPQILFEWGMDETTAGWMLSLMLFVSIPFTFITPVLAGRSPNQILLVVLSASFTLASFIGLIYFGTTLVVLWMILFGIGLGAGFSLAITFMAIRASNPEQAVELSGMSQSVGYMLAGIGPIIFGLLHDLTHTWTSSLVLIVLSNVVFLLVGLGAGRDRVVSTE